MVVAGTVVGTVVEVVEVDAEAAGTDANRIRSTSTNWRGSAPGEETAAWAPMAPPEAKTVTATSPTPVIHRRGLQRGRFPVGGGPPAEVLRSEHRAKRATYDFRPGSKGP